VREFDVLRTVAEMKAGSARFFIRFFRYACAIGAYNEKKNLQMIVFAVFHNITNSD